MILPQGVTPTAPDWRVDWQALDGRFEWIRAMQGCLQDPVHHAEGDVWIHVRMVCEAMAASAEWRGLPDRDRELLFAAALLHDVAKPACTRLDGGRITSRGHSQRGAIQARRILWEFGADFAAREELCALVRHHQAPFHLIERTDGARRARLISQSVRCRLLALLATSDAQGRLCADQAGVLTNVALFRELCGELGCLDEPWPFASLLSRFEYARREDRDAAYAAHDAYECEVILMSGLPGAGKDSWIRAHAPDLAVVSLDDIREETGAGPTGDQGEVVMRAKERARELLRRGQSFVWNSTNLSRDRRDPLVELFTGYHARVRIVYVEATHDALFERNQKRATVPAKAIRRMMERWQVPDVTEAPLVEWWENGAAWRRIGL